MKRAIAFSLNVAEAKLKNSFNQFGSHPVKSSIKVSNSYGCSLNDIILPFSHVKTCHIPNVINVKHARMCNAFIQCLPLYRYSHHCLIIAVIQVIVFDHLSYCEG